ncbi:hypothetical protein BB561_002055 [Smittium simulii]|uniref:Ribosomal protein/NADH dehydrogenase domain-containing protein n=1 Tax=Smittium simulii TaxID=133385 RepID=A0A2T9YRY3_9FUNG|nr:hypothetical protein BB561_002055 [Smittium simulii]
MNNFQKIVQKLETGSAAVKLNPGLKSLNLTFFTKSCAHGARYFWKKDLPKLMYNNPQAKFTVTIPEVSVKPSIEIELDSGKKVIDISGLNSDQVLKKVIESAS